LRSKVMALLAVVAGAASYTLVRGYAAELESLRPTAGDTVQVVVADRDLERGSVIDDGSVRVERMPSAFAPPGALRTTGDAMSMPPLVLWTRYWECVSIILSRKTKLSV